VSPHTLRPSPAPHSVLLRPFTIVEALLYPINVRQVLKQTLQLMCSVVVKRPWTAAERLAVERRLESYVLRRVVSGNLAWLTYACYVFFF
jgi:hypothetical protein